MTVQTLHAVLTTNGLVFCNPKVTCLDVEIPQNMVALFDLALAHKLTHLWVASDVYASLSETFTLDYDVSAWDMKHSWYERFEGGTKVKSPRSVYGWKRKVQPTDKAPAFSLCFLQYSTWNWARSTDPIEILGTISYLEKALDVAIGNSPASVGMRLVKATNANHPEWLARPTRDLEECHFDRSVGRDLVWQASTENAQKHLASDKPLYMHKLDKNSAYLRACQAYHVGVGEPYHVFHDCTDYKRPGVWRVATIGQSKMLSGDVPPVWSGKEWIATPILKLLRDTGHDVQVSEGWTFNTFHMVLKTWSETLYNARQEFKVVSHWKHQKARQNALIGTKQIATETVGLTAYSKFDEDEESWKERPDYKVQIVTGNRAALYYNILKAQKENGIVPIAVYMDALYYISEKQDAFDLAPSLLEKKGLGGYKVEWTLPVTSEVKSILLFKETLNLKLAKLNTLVAQQSEVTHA